MASSRPSDPPPQLSWWGWGDPAQVPDLPQAVLNLLATVLGIRGPGPAPPPLERIALAPSRLTEQILTAVGAILGPEHVADDPETRIRHSGGKSTPDLFRLRAGRAIDPPDLVLAPGTHEEILELLQVCSEHRVAVIPFGGGTSVVGGLSPAAASYAGVIALDLRRMNALVALDEESRLAVLEPGLRGPEAEALLQARGYTIGHFPQSFEYATLGGFAAARSSGQASAGYGRFDELVHGLRVATPAGTIRLGRAPKSAAGPDLRQLILGSEGAFGVITALTVQVRPVPERRVYDGWRFPSFAHGTTALRRLALAIVGYEGSEADVEAAQLEATNVLWSLEGELDEEAGESWARDRFRGPYLRDALIGAGALVETLETATFWSSLHGLYAAVSEALRSSLTEQGTPPIVLCHISHVYPAGASLYYTVCCAALEDPIAQWRTAKAAASEAILAAGGSISHHHGVGVDHREWYLREIGDPAAGALRAIKARLDPAWILNPGILIPEPNA